MPPSVSCSKSAAGKPGRRRSPGCGRRGPPRASRASRRRSGSGCWSGPGRRGRPAPGARASRCRSTVKTSAARSAQDGRLVAAAGADLQHPLAAGQGQLDGHHGDHEGLADRLVEADRHGPVVVGDGARCSGGRNRARESRDRASSTRGSLTPRSRTCRTIAAPGSRITGRGWGVGHGRSASSSWKSLISSCTSRRPFHSLIVGWKASEQSVFGRQSLAPLGQVPADRLDHRARPARHRNWRWFLRSPTDPRLADDPDPAGHEERPRVADPVAAPAPRSPRRPGA